MILERTSAGLCSSLILSEKLYPHLLEIDRAEQERMDAMLPRMMEVAGVTEELKGRDFAIKRKIPALLLSVFQIL